MVRGHAVCVLLPSDANVKGTIHFEQVSLEFSNVRVCAVNFCHLTVQFLISAGSRQTLS